MNYLVTGCSRGVGLEICRVLLEQGHTVYGVAVLIRMSLKSWSQSLTINFSLKV